MCRAYGQRRRHVRCRSSMPSRHGWRGALMGALQRARSRVRGPLGSTPARVRARARGELVHGCGRRVEVGVAGVAPGGVRRVPAASGLDRPSRLGREPLKDSAWTWRTVNGRLWGSVLGLAPARGTAHTAPGGLDRLGSGRRAGLSRRRPPAPAAPGVFAFFFAIPGFRRACDRRLCLQLFMFIMII